jgi:hypothetical protein
VLPKGYLAVSAVSLLLVGWVYGGDVTDALAARQAEVAAFAELPSMGFAAAVLVATLVGAIATGYGALTKKSGAWRGYRVMPIIIVLVLFIDLVFLSASHSGVSSADDSLRMLSTLTNQANLLATSNKVPTAQDLEPLLQPLSPPAYLVKGERAKAWHLVARQSCSGPVDEVKGEPVGTIFYCTSADGQQAWLSLVALPFDSRFGPAEVFKRNGKAIPGLVTTHPDPGPEDQGDEPSSEALQFVPDAGG